METVDVIQKLIALALNNPSREEAMSAALKAVTLIVDKEVTLGGKPAMGYQASASKAWTPDPDFDEVWAKMNRPTNEGNDRPWEGQSNGPQDLKVAAVDTDLDVDFMRTRIKWAWRAIRDERIRLKQEIHRQFTARGEKYPRPEPKDWVPADD